MNFPPRKKHNLLTVIKESRPTFVIETVLIVKI